MTEPTKLQLIAAALREQEQEQVPFLVDVAFGGTCYFVVGPGGRQFGDPFTCESDARKLAKLLNEAFVLGEQWTMTRSESEVCDCKIVNDA